MRLQIDRSAPVSFPKGSFLLLVCVRRPLPAGGLQSSRRAVGARTRVPRPSACGGTGSAPCPQQNPCLRPRRAPCGTWQPSGFSPRLIPEIQRPQCISEQHVAEQRSMATAGALLPFLLPGCPLSHRAGLYQQLCSPFGISSPRHCCREPGNVDLRDLRKHPGNKRNPKRLPSRWCQHSCDQKKK